jgi:hypothetical protein
VIDFRDGLGHLEIADLVFGSISRGRIQRKIWCLGPFAGVDYNLTFCPLQSGLQHVYHGQSYARVDLNPMPKSAYSPVRDFGFQNE